MYQPRSFYIMSVRNNAILTPPIVIEKQFQMSCLRIKNLIREAKTYQISSVLQTARKEGMISMDDALLDLYNKGVIDSDNAIGYAQDVNYVTKRVNQFY